MLPLTVFGQDETIETDSIEKICVTIDVAEEFVNATHELEAQDSLIVAQKNALSKGAESIFEYKNLVKNLELHLSTVKESRLAYKKQWIRTERSRRTWRDIALSGLAGVLVGLVTDDVNIGLYTASGSFLVTKTKLITIPL